MRRPRWLGLFAVVLVVGAAFVVAGFWQMGVAHDDARRAALEEAESRPVVDLTALVEPHSPFPAEGSNQRVRAVGRYESDGQVLVVDRRLDGAAGYWVVTPFEVASTGARIPVVRGFVRSPGDARPPASTAQLTLVGSLAPAESPREPLGLLGPDQLASVDVARLVNVWDGDIYNAFVFAMSETPDATSAGAAGSSATGTIERVPPPDLPSGFVLRNLAYALQWWVFAAFALWMWWKMVRDDHRNSVGAAA